MAKRKICYITGTRADFGLMRSTLELIAADDLLDLGVVATGMHLLEEYGHTIQEIEESGLQILARVPVGGGEPTGALMAKNIARVLAGLVEPLLEYDPDVVMVLGDRGEMLAAALAALHMNIPVAHVHGGEVSGTVDESIRHAISKLSHIHMVATPGSRERLIRMGEKPEAIIVTGAPGLDELGGASIRSRRELWGEYQFDERRSVVLLLHHPVVQHAETGGNEIRELMAALSEAGVQVLALKPNSDAGSSNIRSALEDFAGHADLRLVTHFPRADYVAWLKWADAIVGNSSSGIIEAASFGTPVVNVGDRQNMRERNLNVIDVAATKQAVLAGLDAALKHGRWPKENIYGDGQAGKRIAGVLRDFPLNADLLAKSNAY